MVGSWEDGSGARDVDAVIRRLKQACVKRRRHAACEVDGGFLEDCEIPVNDQDG